MSGIGPLAGAAGEAMEDGKITNRELAILGGLGLLALALRKRN